MSELLDGVSDTPVNESAEAQPAAGTGKKRTRKRMEPGAEETAAPAVKRTRRKKASAEEPVVEQSIDAAAEEPIAKTTSEAEAVTVEPPVVQEAVEVEVTVLQGANDAVAVGPIVGKAVVAIDEPFAGETVVNEEVEVAEEPVVAADAMNESIAGVEQPMVVDAVASPEDELLVIASKPSESVEQEPPAAVVPPATPLLPIKFRPAEATSVSVDPSKRRRIEETERRQRRTGGSQETDSDRSFRIEPIAVRGPRAERDAAKKERAQALRDPGAPIIPPDVKVFVPTPSMATLPESEPKEEIQPTSSVIRAPVETPAVSANRMPLSARLQKVQELFAARETHVSAAQPESPVSSTKPDIVNEGEPLVTSTPTSPIPPNVLPPASTPVPVVMPPTARSVQSPIWHKGLARNKTRSKPRAKPAVSRRKTSAAASKPIVRRSAAKPFSPHAKRLVKEAAGRIGGRRRKSGR